MDRRDAVHDRAAHRVVVDQVAESLADLGLGEDRVLLVQADVPERSLGRFDDPDILGGAQRFQLLGLQVAGDIDVAFLQKQALGRGFGDMAEDDALHFRSALPVGGVGVECQ